MEWIFAKLCVFSASQNPSQFSHVSSPQVLKYDISFGSQFLKSTVCMSQLLFCGSEILCSSEANVTL